MKNAGWIVGAIVGIILLVLLFGGGTMMGRFGYRGWGMTGPGGMMGNWGYAPAGGGGMLLGWLIPVGIIVLIVLGIVWIMRHLG